MSIIMSQLLINVDSSLWYMDPILSIVLAVFMAAFGIKVISQNFNILRPGGHGASTLAPWSLNKSQNLGTHQKAAYSAPLIPRNNNQATNYESNLQASWGRAGHNWQKSDYSTIAFV